MRLLLFFVFTVVLFYLYFVYTGIHPQQKVATFQSLEESKGKSSNTNDSKYIKINPFNKNKIETH